MRSVLFALACALTFVWSSPAFAESLSADERKELIERKKREIERRRKEKYCADDKHKNERTCKELARDKKNKDDDDDDPPSRKPKVGQPEKPGDDVKRERNRDDGDAPRKGERDREKDDDRTVTKPPRDEDDDDRPRKTRPTPP